MDHSWRKYSFPLLFFLVSPSHGGAFALSGTVLEKGSKAPVVGAGLYLESLAPPSPTPDFSSPTPTGSMPPPATLTASPALGPSKGPSPLTPNLSSPTPSPTPFSLAMDVDPKGRYQASVPEGVYRLTVAAEGFEKAAVFSLPVTQDTRQDFYLEREGFTLPEVVVSARRGSADEVSRETLSKEELASVPGTAGDVLRALQTLPGVATAGDFSGQLLVRGGGPEDNLYLSDRIPIAFPFHFGGLLSTLNSDLIRSVDFSAGGFGPEYGNYWGGVVDVANRDPRRDRWGGRAEVNMLLSEILVEGPTSENSSLALAGRRSYMELLKGFFSDFTAIPSFGDYQAKWSYDHSPATHWDVQVLGSDDRLGLTIKADSLLARHDPAYAGDFEFHNGFNSQGVNYRRLCDGENTILETAYHYNFFFDTHFGRDLFLDINFEDFGNRLDFIHDFSPDDQLTVGTEWDHYLVRDDALFVVLPGEGVADFDLTSSGKIRSQFSTFSNNVSLYFDQKFKWFSKKATFSIGGRLDYQSYNDKMDLSPRFSASYALSEETTLKGSFGYYYQLPVDGPELNPDFGNPRLSSQLALSTVLGVEQKLGREWFLRVEAYNKDLSRVVVGDPVLRYSNAGVGFNRGLELFLRRSPDERLFGWVSCALSDGERLNGPNQSWHPYDYDQPLIATVVTGYKVTPQWEAGFKWRFSSGQPQTPVTGAYYDPVNDRYIAFYGPVNSGRLPDYSRLDFSTSYTTVYDTWQWRVFLEILNVTNNPNVFGYDYNFDYTDRKELHQFPFLPYLGIEAKY